MNTSNTKEIILSVFSVAIKVVVIIIAAMFIYKYALIGYDYGYRIFGEKPVSRGDGRKVTVNISSSMGVSDIGELLESKGLIRDAKLFLIQERLSENHGKIEPGTYELSTAMTAEQMIAIMASATDDSLLDDEEKEDLPIGENGLLLDEGEMADDIQSDSEPNPEAAVEGNESVGEETE